jgi:hypothetical protein
MSGVQGDSVYHRVSLNRARVTKWTLQPVDRLNVTNYIDNSLPQQETNYSSIYPSDSQITSTNLFNRGYGFGLLLLWKFLVISFRFGVRLVESIFITSRCVQ